MITVVVGGSDAMLEKLRFLRYTASIQHSQDGTHRKYK
jgi:hypothetical protein